MYSRIPLFAHAPHNQHTITSHFQPTCYTHSRDTQILCTHRPLVTRLRMWLPTRVLRDCRFAATAELDLRLYAIGCDIVRRASRCSLRAALLCTHSLCMCPTPPSCNCGTLQPGSLQVSPPLPPPLHLQPVRSCPPPHTQPQHVSHTCAHTGTNLSLAKYLRPERLPAVFRSIDW